MDNGAREFCIIMVGAFIIMHGDDATESDMPHVLVVHELETVRADLNRALMGEGFTVTEADSSLAAVREIWQGTFDAAMIGERLPGVGGATLDDHLRGLAPEIVTVPITKEPAARLARKLAELLEGGAVAA